MRKRLKNKPATLVKYNAEKPIDLSRISEESLDEDGVKDGDLVDVDKKEEKVSSLVDIDLHSKDAEQNESSEETDDEGE